MRATYASVRPDSAESSAIVRPSGENRRRPGGACGDEHWALRWSAGAPAPRDEGENFIGGGFGSARDRAQASKGPPEGRSLYASVLPSAETEVACWKPFVGASRRSSPVAS